jgi:hypothetical protein
VSSNVFCDTEYQSNSWSLAQFAWCGTKLEALIKVMIQHGDWMKRMRYLELSGYLKFLAPPSSGEDDGLVLHWRIKWTRMVRVPLCSGEFILEEITELYHLIICLYDQPRRAFWIMRRTPSGGPIPSVRRSRNVDAFPRSSLELVIGNFCGNDFILGLPEDDGHTVVRSCHSSFPSL